MEELLADEENQSRRTFCQIPLNTIYDISQKGQDSVDNLLQFLAMKNDIEKKSADCILGHFNEIHNGKSELCDYEERGTSVRGVLYQWQNYYQTMNSQQLIWTQVIDEHVSKPLESLRDASTTYIQTLQVELTRVIDEYNEADAQQRKVRAICDAARNDLNDALTRQDDALHEIGVPSFELQRLAARVHRCRLELTRALAEKEQAKQTLLKRIISRDEMTMAISVSYQRAEEERRDQMATSMKLWLAVEKEHIKFREKQIQQLEEHVVRMDRAGDVQLLIHNHRDPDNLQFQGKALSLIDWIWKQDVSMKAYDQETPISEECVQDSAIRSGENEAIPSPHNDNVESLLAKHFTSESTGNDTSETIATQCATADGRQSFVQALNRQRSIVTRIECPSNFTSLVACFHAFFDACVEHNDVKSAKTAMMLSATFYAIPIAESTLQQDEHHRHSRRYIQEEVKAHPIWRNPKFWEKALLLAIGEELQKSPQRCPWEDLPSNVPRSQGIFTREEAVSHVHNVVFGQLGSFTLSMLEFDVPITQIRYFIETMCVAHELTEEQRFLLRANLREIVIKLGYFDSK